MLIDLAVIMFIHGEDLILHSMLDYNEDQGITFLQS